MQAIPSTIYVPSSDPLPPPVAIDPLLDPGVKITVPVSPIPESEMEVKQHDSIVQCQ